MPFKTAMPYQNCNYKRLAAPVFYAILICHVLCCNQSVAHAETIKWGPYSVTSKQLSFSKDTDRTWRVQIISSTGITLREIHGFNFAHIKVLDIGLQRNPILMFELGDGGNDAQNLVYAYSYSKSTGIKNIVATHGTLDNLKFKDTRLDDLSELIIDDSEALLQFDHFSRFALGNITRIYEWNGDVYQERTPKHIALTSAKLSSLRLQFLHSLPAAENYVRGSFINGKDDSMASSHEDVMKSAISYLANAIVDGKSAEAEQLFRRRASPQLQAWLTIKRRLVIEALSTGSKNIRTDDSKLVGT